MKPICKWTTVELKQRRDTIEVNYPEESNRPQLIEEEYTAIEHELDLREDEEMFPEPHDEAESINPPWWTWK